MSKLNIQEQLVREHASLIFETVRAVGNKQAKEQLLKDLAVAEQNGWGNLVNAISKILNGVLDVEELGNLDPEDEIIVRAIIQGIADPDTLPNPSDNQNPMLAPAGLAGIIAEAARGEENAMQMLAVMDTDLSESSEPELVELGKTLKRLLIGERDLDSLTINMNDRSRTLIQSVLEELKRLGV